MRLEPQIPSAQDAVRHFQNMAHGQLPKTETRKRALYGSWGGGGPTVLRISTATKQPIVKTTLVTPTAMALEQAKSQLMEAGEKTPIKKTKPSKKKSVSLGVKGGKVKKAGEKLPAKKPPKKKKSARPGIKGSNVEAIRQLASSARRGKTSPAT